MANQITPLKAGSLKRLLKPLRFFADSAEHVFIDAEGASAEVVVANKDPLLTEGGVSPYAWFLVDGSVTLEREGKAPITLTAGDEDAHFPIANLRPSRYTVVPSVQARLVRMEQAFLKSLRQDLGTARFVTANQNGGGSWQSHPFAIEVIQARQDSQIPIPPMPGISLKVSDALRQPDFDIEDLTRIISADPALAGKLMGVANSAIFQRREPCQTLHAAIVRLGFGQVRSLVTAFATKSLFNSRQPFIRNELKSHWRHSVDIACFTTVLAGLTPELEPAQAMLMGLLHEVGTTGIYHLATGYPRLEQTPGILASVVSNIAPGVGATTLTEWGLEEFAAATPHQEDWSYKHEGPVNYADLLIVAHLHQRLLKRDHDDLPRLDQIPAFNRLTDLGLTATVGITLLEEAKKELAELRSLLS